jgi:hypothetical protein
MADLLISSTRGGLNNTDPALSLPEDQCLTATNVEWTTSGCGERRRGSTAIDLSGSGLTAQDRIPFIFQHLPSSDASARELWALGMTGTTTANIRRKDTSWHTVTPTDAITTTGTYQYQLHGRTLHGKLFLAYKSAQNRLHVWDGTTLRRCGLAMPTTAPTGGDAGAGSFSGTRYYRVREAVLSGTTVLLRSEPSAALTYVPSGSGTGVIVTKPTDMGESATHWELEASLALDGDYYRIARTVVGTGTVEDTVAYSSGYALTGTLSEDVGDYLPPHSARYLLADEDRLILFGSFEDDALAARMAWTPVYTDTGVGSDERLTTDPVSYLDLDTYEGGPITGAVGPVNGEIWVFKWGHVYKAVRTGNRQRAYEVIAITKSRGAIPGSMTVGVDALGSPCAYFLDPQVGPCRIGADGVVKRCGRDIFTTWQTVNINAVNVVARVVFFETVGQVHWFVATGSSDVPDTRLVLHVEETRDGVDGVRRGWAIWNGPSAAALSVCLYSDNIDDNAARNLSVVPFVGLSSGATILRTNTGITDNGTSYTATMQSKPRTPISVLHHFGVESGSLLAKATAGAVVTVTATRNFGAETMSVSDIDLTPTASETQVVKLLDHLSLSELRVVDVTITDGAGLTARWEVNQIALRVERGQAA